MDTEKRTVKNGKTNSGPVASGVDNRPQFVQYRLTDDQLNEAKSACEDMTDFANIVVQFVESGYKFAVSVDKYGGGVQAFLTPTQPDGPNWGWTLTARGPDLESATGVLAYKHFRLFDGVWPKNQAPKQGSKWG